jgi:hypothetical protein
MIEQMTALRQAASGWPINSQRRRPRAVGRIAFWDVHNRYNSSILGEFVRIYPAA